MHSNIKTETFLSVVYILCLLRSSSNCKHRTKSRNPSKNTTPLLCFPPSIMESNNHRHLIFLLFLTILFTTISCNTTSPSPSPSPSPPPSQSTPPPSPPVMQEINNILNALIGSGDIPTAINKWVGILSMSNPNSNSNPLLTITLFIPQQQQDPTKPLDPFSFPYHVVPQRLTFSDLLLIPRNARLPTLLPGKSISITDNSAANFSLDGIPLTHPDLYSTSSLSVHGVQTLLDYSLFGDASAMPRTPSPPFLPVGETWKSGAVSSSASFSLFFFFCRFLLQQLFFV